MKKRNTIVGLGVAFICGLILVAMYQSKNPPISQAQKASFAAARSGFVTTSPFVSYQPDKHKKADKRKIKEHSRNGKRYHRKGKAQVNKNGSSHHKKVHHSRRGNSKRTTPQAGMNPVETAFSL